MGNLRFCIHHLAYWVQERPLHDVSSLPVLLRRRVSTLGQQALHNAWHLPDATRARIIFSSRHVEVDRTVSIMESLAQQEMISPADFSLSTHHTLVGLLSIAQKNTKGHTAIAAGSESLFFGLIEAASCLAENPDEPILLIHYNQSLPAPFDVFNTTCEPSAALALLLTAQDGKEISFSVIPNQDGTMSTDSHSQQFIHFIESNTSTMTSLGERHTWYWKQHG